jgi:hypothetical protein
MSTGRALENFARCAIAQRLVRPLVVVERQPPADAPPACATEPYALMNASSYFRLRHSRSMKMLYRYRPLPSMLIHTPRVSSPARKSVLVNCTPWSVLKMSGCPCRSIASCSASTQNAVPMLIDTCHARTRRLTSVSLARAKLAETRGEPVHHHHQVDEPLRHLGLSRQADRA